jgi:hypothetical protein
MARFGHTATLLIDGRVLIAGGCIKGQFGDPTFCRAATGSAELYDPITGTFTATGNMTTPRWSHAASLLPDGRVLIAAGHGDGGSDNNLATAELYDPSTGAFTRTGDMTMPSAHDTNTATLLSDGQVLITGCCFRAELYDPATGTFTATGNMTTPTPWATATLLSDGRVLLAAAFSPPKLYDPRAGVFTLTSTPSITPGKATLLPNGKVLVAGSWNDDPGPNFLAELYDPSKETFDLTGNMTARRANHTVTLLPDGKVLITGGSSGTSNTTTSGISFFCCVANAELYDTSTGLFAGTGSMSVNRGGHTATLLNSGEVLIAGGVGTATAELYHPEEPIPAPSLFSLSGDGRGQGAIWHAGTGVAASPSNPAIAGETLSMYTTSLADDGIIPPQVAVGGRLAEVVYFGDAPGYPGYSQVNFRVPAGVASGFDVSVRLTYLGRPSNAVTIAVQ